MTGPGTDDFDEALDDATDAVILDRMTETLMILQCKHPTEDRAAMIAALKAIRDHQGVTVILVEGQSEELLVRQFLDKLNRTSLGTNEIYVARANAGARRVADILGRAMEQPGKAE